MKPRHVYIIIVGTYDHMVDMVEKIIIILKWQSMVVPRDLLADFTQSICLWFDQGQNVDWLCPNLCGFYMTLQGDFSHNMTFPTEIASNT